MRVDSAKKKELIETYGRSKTDTGSPETQIAILTNKITNLTEHMQSHRKDFHSRRGLLRMVRQRRRLLDYLKKRKLETYQKMLEALGLRR